MHKKTYRHTDKKKNCIDMIESPSNIGTLDSESALLHTRLCIYVYVRFTPTTNAISMFFEKK